MSRRGDITSRRCCDSSRSSSLVVEVAPAKVAAKVTEALIVVIIK